MNSYDVGDVIRMRATFTNSAGAVVDPSSVTLQYRALQVDPSSYENLVYGVGSIVRTGTGDFYHDFQVNSYSGEYRYRWNGSGANAAGGEKSFQVRTKYIGG